MPLKRFHRNKLNKMQKVNTRFSCRHLDHITAYYYDSGLDAIRNEYSRLKYGNEFGSYKKVILTSKVMSALFEVL